MNAPDHYQNYQGTCCFFGTGGTWISPAFNQTVLPTKIRYICEHCFSIMQVDANKEGIIRCEHCGAPVTPLEEYMYKKRTQ